MDRRLQAVEKRLEGLENDVVKYSQKEEKDKEDKGAA